MVAVVGFSIHVVSPKLAFVFPDGLIAYGDAYTDRCSIEYLPTTSTIFVAKQMGDRIPRIL